jgi:hypothetical protein
MLFKNSITNTTSTAEQGKLLEHNFLLLKRSKNEKLLLFYSQLSQSTNVITSAHFADFIKIEISLLMTRQHFYRLSDTILLVKTVFGTKKFRHIRRFQRLGKGKKETVHFFLHQ